MIKPVSVQNIQLSDRNLLNNVSKKCNETTYFLTGELPHYPISFCSAQIQRHSKGSTPYVAKQLKALDGTLDEKLPKAKDIILKDMGLPDSIVECVDKDLGGGGYAAYSAPLGKIMFDKEFCRKPDSEFSDDAIMCILRHEIDHLEVFVKLYKKMGGDEFEKFVLNSEILSGSLPKEERKVNHEFYSEMSKYVNVDNFDADKYINAINNYYHGGSLGDSHYKNFTIITKNFDNALEDSAREKQYELEKLMGVTTLRDFYSMIDETKNLISEIKAKGISDEKTMQETFDNLYNQALQTTGMEDKTQNWGKLIKAARVINRL